MRKTSPFVFLFFLISILFSSCSFLDSRENTSVSFVLNEQIVQTVKKDIISRSTGRAAEDAALEGAFIEVSLLGDITDKRTISLKEGEKVVFDNLAIGSRIYISAVIYLLDSSDTSKRINLYRGQSDYIVLTAGDNPVSLKLKKIQSDESQAETYTITFILNGGSWSEGYTVITEYTRESGLNLPDAACLFRSDYDFMGWFTSSDGGMTLSDNSVSKIEPGTIGNLTFYADWMKTPFYVNSSASGTNADGTEENPFATIAAALTKITELNDTEEKYRILARGTFAENVILQDLPAKLIIIEGSSNDGSDKITGDGASGYPVESYENISLKNISVIANGNLGVNIHAGKFTLENGAKIVCTAAESTGSSAIMVCSSLVMKGDAKITGFKQTSGYIVYLQGSNTRLVMNDTAEISDCKSEGGAVFIKSGYMEMNNDSKISNCETIQYGGGVNVSKDSNSDIKGSLVMNGNASIESCSAKVGGGIYIGNGSVTMNDNSTVTDCTGSKISALNDRFSAGGIDVDTDGTLTINGNASIKNCTGNGYDCFGGIYSKGTVYMNGGSISSNSTTTYYDYVGSGAGGVCVADGTFTMRDGSISDNKGSAYGGVYIAGGATFDMQGGVISANQSLKGKGSGVIVGFSYSGATLVSYGVFKMSGSAKVSNNNDVSVVWYSSATSINLPQIISIAGPLTASSPVATLAFYTITEPTTGGWAYNYVEGRTVLAMVSGVTSTTLEAVADKFAVKASSDSNWVIDVNGTLQKKILTNPSTTHLYVAQNGSNLNNGESSATAFKTISKATEFIAAYGSTGKNYTITVNGTLTGGQTLTSSLNDKASSITIEGATGKSGDDWVDVLNGGFTDNSRGTTLTVSTNVPITIKNLKITGGYVGEGSGGGVRINADGVLNMESGEISGNTGNRSGQAAGGGVYMAHGNSYNPHTEGAIFNMTGGSICNNTGDGVCIYDGSNPGTFTMTGGTISGNTGYGVDLVYSTGPSPTFKMGGSALVTSDNKVFLPLLSMKIEILSSLTGTMPVATITPHTELYKGEYPVLALAEGVTETSLPAEAGKFSVETSVPNFIGGNGKLVQKKTAPDAVGDIVFTDGTAVAYSSSLVMNDIQKEKAVAIIFYSEDENTTAPLGEKMLGVGLNYTYKKWCIESAKGYKCGLDMYCSGGSSGDYTEITKSNGYYEFTGLKDGSGAWQTLKNYLASSEGGGIDDTTTEGKYPAWEWVNSYGTTYNLQGDFTNGWYLPTIAEAAMLCNNYYTMNQIFTLLGSTISFANATGYWWTCTCSANSSIPTVFYINGSSPVRTGYSKENSEKVLVIREFTQP